MKFYVKNGNIEKQRTASIVIGIFEPSRLSRAAEKIDKISQGYISSLIKSGDLDGRIEKTLLLYHVPKILSERVLLIGCGKEREFNEQKYKKVICKTLDVLNNSGATEAIYFLTELCIKGRKTYWKIRYAIEAIKEFTYVFDMFKSQKIKYRRFLKKITFNVSERRELKNGRIAIQHGLAITAGIKIAKDLGNMPPNVCDSTYLSNQVQKLSIHNKKIFVQIINEQQMKILGMHAYLAVSSGSENESFILIMKYYGNENLKKQPIVLVGKGLTFDTGGISIKPANNMDEMKYDMCGAAAVYGAMCVATELSLPLNIISILAVCENMVDGRSFRPGDVVKTLSGKTVEILNTDAEGRLVLCDVLTYVERLHPEIVIDIATLTGACVIALGNHFTGLMSNNNSLAYELMHAANQSQDYAWRLPLENVFQKQLHSNIADMTNVGGRSGGAITAGYFLSQFAKKYKWAHLDIAGTSCFSGKKKGATGRPVAMISQFLINRSQLNIE